MLMPESPKDSFYCIKNYTFIYHDGTKLSFLVFFVYILKINFEIYNFSNYFEQFRKVCYTYYSADSYSLQCNYRLSAA